MISIINNILFYIKNKTTDSNKFIEKVLPHNIKYMKYIVFFNTNDYYNMCHINDDKNKKYFDRYFIEMISQNKMDSILKLYPNKCYIVTDKTDNNFLNLSGIDLEKINQISSKN